MAQRLLGAEGTRLPHVRAAGFLAGQLGPLLDRAEADLLVAAATLHDIGYSAHVRHTGFHPLDGGLHLARSGFSERLAALVAHHSLAHVMAPPELAGELCARFPREESLLVDALVYADMHSAPDGRIIRGEDRLADIGARRPFPHEVERAHGLRAAMGRVGAAILESASSREAGRHSAPRGSGFRRWWLREAAHCVTVAQADGGRRTASALHR